MVDHALGPAGTLASQDGDCGSGVYLLTGARESVGPSEQSCRQLTLEDATGRVTGFVWPEARPYVACPVNLPAAVTVRAGVQCYHDQPQLRIHSLVGLSNSEVSSATALLPRLRCPAVARPALDRLAQLERELPLPLDGFLREVLLDPKVMLPFLTCRASVRHHHAFQGGLLVHSTQMLDAVRDRAKQALPDDEWAPSLCQLGYLLHDLGKLRSVGTNRRPQYALVVPHEQLTLYLLGPHLRWLELRNNELAIGLLYVFSYLARPASGRGLAEYEIARIVEMHDQMSASGFNQRGLGRLLNGWKQQPAIVRAMPHRGPARQQPEARHGEGARTLTCLPAAPGLTESP